MLGPSGSGKTTLLRMIAGFERPDEGTVELAGVDVTRDPPYLRNVNTVFQDYALFPHMTVRQNVEYGLGLQGCASETRRKAEAALDMFASRIGRAQAGSAVGGQRPACRAGPGHRERARGVAARRAARCA